MDAKVLRWARLIQPLLPVGRGIRNRLGNSNSSGWGNIEDLPPNSSGDGSGRGRGYGYAQGAGKGCGFMSSFDGGGGSPSEY